MHQPPPGYTRPFFCERTSVDKVRRTYLHEYFFIHNNIFKYVVVYQLFVPCLMELYWILFTGVAVIDTGVAVITVIDTVLVLVLVLVLPRRCTWMWIRALLCETHSWCVWRNYSAAFAAPFTDLTNTRVTASGTYTILLYPSLSISTFHQATEPALTS